MKITLIKPPQFLEVSTYAMNPSPPLGLAYIAAALEKAGHQIQVIDATGEAAKQFNPLEFIPNTSKPLEQKKKFGTIGLSTKEIADRIPLDTQIIGFSCMFSNNWIADRYLIEFLGEKFPKAVIIAGGESITGSPSLWISQTKHLEVCVLGEGEETVVDLIEAIESGKQLGDVSGIAFRQNDTNETIITPKKSRSKNLDAIPPPAWKYFPVENYQAEDLAWGISSRKSLPLLATRGCPYSCTFCSSPKMWGTRYYMRSPQSVADEMEMLMDQYGISNFDFYDLTAIIRREWIIEFSNEILNRKLDITWQIPAGTRSEAIDAEVARCLYVSGCRNITYAPESGSERVLKLIKKKVSLDKMMQSMKHSRKEKMHVFINIILALPDETHLDVWKTFWFLIKCSWNGVNESGVTIFQPYPGSELFERLVSEKKIDLSNDDFFLNILFITSYEKCSHYNDSVSQRWYDFYKPMVLIVFYTSGFIFRPVRLLRTIRNFFTGIPQTRTERAIKRLLGMRLSNMIRKFQIS